MIALLSEIAGFVCLAVAAVLWMPLVGLVVIGVELLIVGFLVDYTGAEPSLPRPRLRRRKPPVAP